MGKITVNAPADQVFEAVSDLTRHAAWAAHPINIAAEQDGPIWFGHKYSSGKTGKKLDRITVTEYSPNDRFGFQVVMPNGWELDWTITLTAQGEATEVERTVKVTKIPTYMKPMLLVIAMVGPIFERTLTRKMKAELEGAAS